MLIICGSAIFSPTQCYVFTENDLCFRFLSLDLVKIPYSGIIEIESFHFITPWYKILYKKNNRIKSKNLLPLRNMSKFIREIKNTSIHFCLDKNTQ